MARHPFTMEVLVPHRERSTSASDEDPVARNGQNSPVTPQRRNRIHRPWRWAYRQNRSDPRRDQLSLPDYVRYASPPFP